MSLAQSAPPTLPFLAGAGSVQRARWRLGPLQTAYTLLDAAILILGGAIAASLLPAGVGAVPARWGALAGLVAAATAWSLEHGFRHAPLPIRLARIVLACCAGGLTLLILDRGWHLAAGWVVAEASLAGSLRAILQALYRRITGGLLAGGRVATHIAVIGDGPVARRLCAQLDNRAGPPIRLVGRYRLGAASDDDDRGPLAALLSDCRLHTVDAVIVALEPGQQDALATTLRALRACIQDVYLAADLLDAAPPGARVFALGHVPLLLLRRRPLHGWRGIAKIAFDQAVAWSLILLIAPVLILIALAIRLETPGPILFRQLRVGYNNRLFYILKFRSMYSGATDRLAKQQTVRGDKRVTRVGQIIRRLSLDELPQLFNVVRGEMSLVGPRPHAPGTSIGGRRVHTLVADYASRHVVRPGITGLAQVRGLRGGLHDRRHVRDRVAADLEYIERWSVWLDLKILLWTVLLEIRETRGV